MATTTHEVIFLGNFADADTNEGSFTLEDSSVYLDTFGSAGDPLNERQINMDFNDSNNSGDIGTDNTGSLDSLSYDLGSGTQVTDLDSLAVVSLTATYADGSVANFNNVVMFQDTAGNLFLTNSNFAGTDLNQGGALQSINVTGIQSNYTGLWQNNLQEFVCFGNGTLIDTPDGPRPVETLRPGDLVDTLDAGPQPLLWVGARRLDFTQGANPAQKPIELKPGSMGPHLPRRSLILSPQHRVMITNEVGQECLAIAKALLPAKGVRRMQGRKRVTYHTLLLDQHHILFAEGVALESLYPGAYALSLLSPAQRLSILALFPKVLDNPAKNYGPVARPILRRKEAEGLAFRGLDQTSRHHIRLRA